MKKIILYALVIIGFTACDIERLPYDKYTKDQIYDDPELMLNGCYARLKVWAENMHFVGEYGGDNITKQNTSTDAWYEYITYNHTPTNYRIEYFWNYGYKIISQASDLIKHIDENNLNDDQKLGEAYCLRGMVYFYLVRTFGRPYYQEPEKNLGLPLVNGLPDDVFNLDLPDRATVKATYEQIISDLQKAESLLPDEKNTIYASKYAAQALLSRIYLYMSGTYENPNIEYADKAIEYADKVLNSGKFDLLSRNNYMKYNQLTPDANSQTETIFAVKRLITEFTNSQLNGSPGGMYSTIDGLGWGEVYASGDYLDLMYETKGADARFEFIKPDYVDETKVFRFIAERYNTAGAHTGYNYQQFDVTEKGGTLYAVEEKEVNGVKQTTEFPLTGVDPSFNNYSITYEGKNYSGYIDKRITISNGYPRFYVHKCSLEDGQSQLHSPIIVRLAEMYMNKAEAYAKKGQYDNARTALNTIRERSIEGGGYATLNANNAKELIEKERRMEFAFEAHRVTDVFRIGNTMKRAYPGSHDQFLEIDPYHNRVVKYLPANDVNSYPGPLTQNP